MVLATRIERDIARMWSTSGGSIAVLARCSRFCDQHDHARVGTHDPSRVFLGNPSR